MEQITLQAKPRTELGTTAAQTLRRQGWIPGVVYGKGHASRPVMVDRHALLKILHGKAGEHALIHLHVEADGHATPAAGKARGQAGGLTVLIKEVQHHAVTGNVRHIDFHQVSLTEKIKVNVPVVATGESIGVKQDGGVLEYLLRDIEVECLPTQIPDRVTLDISALKIGDSLHARDIVLPDGVALQTGPEAVVLSVLAVKEEKLPEPGAEAMPTEPEVLKQKKPEELEAEAAAKAAEKGKKAEGEAKKE